MALNDATVKGMGSGTQHNFIKSVGTNVACLAVSPGNACSTIGGFVSTTAQYMDAASNPFYTAAYGSGVSTPGANLPCVGPAATGCSPPTKYAASLSFDATGVITATAQATSGLNAELFVLLPSDSGGRVDWAVSGRCKTRAGGALC